MNVNRKIGRRELICTCIILIMKEKNVNSYLTCPGTNTYVYNSETF